MREAVSLNRRHFTSRTGGSESDDVRALELWDALRSTLSRCREGLRPNDIRGRMFLRELVAA